MVRLYLSVLLIMLAVVFGNAQQKQTRYVFIEAPCKSQFEVFPGIEDKQIITNIFEVSFANSMELINAEDALKSDFKIEIKNKYPASVNHVKEILVYMVNTKDEAEELKNTKLKALMEKETKVIDLYMEGGKE